MGYEMIMDAVNAYDEARCKFHGPNEKPMSDRNKLTIAPMIEAAINVAVAPLTVRIKRLEEALKMFQSYGCPVCGGDCASANPPVTACPVQQARAALEDK